jgi:hypothetical protein
MSKIRFSLNALGALLFLCVASSLVQAQATRTWVSGVGDDVNPCSRTAPCKTFAGAISKTATGGEINAIDSGGFGAVTITKSITIDGNGVHAGILAAGTTGVIVNITVAAAAPNTDTVTLRNLSINGAGSGTNGVRILSSVANSTVHIENCQIFGFRSGNVGDAGRGIIDKRTASGAKLFISNTVVRNNAANGIQIGIDTGFVSSVTASLDNVRSVGNTFSGAFFGGGSKTTVRDSVFNANANAGIQVSAQAGGTTSSDIISTGMSYNAFGLFAGPNAATIFLGDVTVTGNTSSGVSLSGATVESFGNNNVRGNAAGNTAGTNIGQQ